MPKIMILVTVKIFLIPRLIILMMKIDLPLKTKPKDDFTEYYKLVYEYLTDCLSFNLNYNKSFYKDGSLEPDETISFLIKIIHSLN